MTYGYCHCGCGVKTRIATQNIPKLHHKKGKPVKYLPGHHLKDSRRPDYLADKNGCWLWQKGRNKAGYAMSGKGHYIHRIHYEKYKGKIPMGKEIDHLCNNRHCVNPDHLEAVSHIENVRRGKRSTVIKIANEIKIYARENNVSYRAIGRYFGITHNSVSRILKNF